MSQHSHSDHLNTPRKLTDASGQAAWQWSYSAFGEDKPTLAKNRFANLDTTPNPGMTGISEVKFNLRYPGQYADEESGLFYNYFRSYEPRTGRYPQGDPIGLDGGWNRFNYVDGNPLGATDPKGLIKVCFFPGGCVDTNPPPVHPDFPDSGSPPLLSWPKLLPDSWVDGILEAAKPEWKRERAACYAASQAILKACVESACTDSVRAGCYAAHASRIASCNAKYTGR